MLRLGLAGAGRLGPRGGRRILAAFSLAAWRRIAIAELVAAELDDANHELRVILFHVPRQVFDFLIRGLFLGQLCESDFVLIRQRQARADVLVQFLSRW